MQKWMRKGNSWLPTSDAKLNIIEMLPPENFMVQFNQMSGFYLEQIVKFDIPKKLYGGVQKRAERILNTFYARPQATGVLLSGDKGSGKTMLAKLIANIAAAKYNMPTVVVSGAYTGDAFNVLIQDIAQPAVILFDEFEKVYDGEEQKQILTLLDGIYGSKKLFILTCNDKFRVDSNMKNRPGRIFYSLDYTRLGHEFIVEYCEDRLNEKKHSKVIANLAVTFDEFNFDMLSALVEEMNRYQEDPFEAITMLNLSPGIFHQHERTQFVVTLWINGREIKDSYLEHDRTNPLMQNEVIIYYNMGKKNGQTVTFTQDDLTKVDDNGVCVFDDGNGRIAQVTRAIETSFTFDRFRGMDAFASGYTSKPKIPITSSKRKG